MFLLCSKPFAKYDNDSDVDFELLVKTNVFIFLLFDIIFAKY
jgi:hypothetical protein